MAIATVHLRMKGAGSLPRQRTPPTQPLAWHPVRAAMVRALLTSLAVSACGGKVAPLSSADATSDTGAAGSAASFDCSAKFPCPHDSVPNQADIADCNHRLTVRCGAAFARLAECRVHAARCTSIGLTDLAADDVVCRREVDELENCAASDGG
jgi:hypothetical protein